MYGCLENIVNGATINKYTDRETYLKLDKFNSVVQK